MNIRELYARDSRGDHGKGIDTGFGILSLSGRNAGGTIVIGDDIVFADVGPVEELDETEDIRLEAR